MASAGKRQLEAVIRLSGVLDQSVLKTFRAAQKEIDKMDYAKRLERIGGRVEKAGKALSRYVTAPLIAAGTLATKVFTDYDDALRQVQATLAATPNEVRKLDEAAKDMGVNTRYMASDAAYALNALAQAGNDADQSIGLLPETLRAAQAGGLGLEQAASLVTESMAALGLQAKDMPGFIDEIARTAQSSNTNIAALAEGITTIGADARKLAGGTAELNTQLGILANYGIKGSEGGTQLRNVLKSLTTQTAAAKKQLDKLGVSVYDSAGNMRATNEIFSELRRSLADMTQQQKDAALSDIFNKRDIKGAMALMNESGAGFDILYGKINNANGAAARMAADMESGLGGTMREMKSAAEGAAIALGETLAPYIKKAAGYIRDLSKRLTKLKPQTKEMIVKLAGIAAAAGPVLVIFGKLIKTMGVLGQSSSGLVSALGKVGGTLSIIALVGVAIYGVVTAINEIEKAQTKIRLAERFGDMELSANDLQAALDKLNTPLTAKIEYFVEQSEKVKQAWENIKEAKGQIDEINFQIEKVDLETDEAKAQELADALGEKVMDYSREVYNLIGHEYFEMKAGFDIVDADLKSSAITDIQEQIQGYLYDRQGEITEATSALATLINSEIWAGMSAEEKTAAVNQTVSDINEVLSRVAGEKANAEWTMLLSKAKYGDLSYEALAELREQMKAVSDEKIKGIEAARDAEFSGLAMLYNDPKNKMSEDEYRQKWDAINDVFGAQAARTAAEDGAQLATLYQNAFNNAWGDEASYRDTFRGIEGAFKSAIDEFHTKNGPDAIIDSSNIKGIYNDAIWYAKEYYYTKDAGKEAEQFLKDYEEYSREVHDQIQNYNDYMQETGEKLFDDDVLNQLKDMQTFFANLDMYAVRAKEGKFTEFRNFTSKDIDSFIDYANEYSRAGEAIPEAVAEGIDAKQGEVRTALQTIAQIIREGLAGISGMRITLPTLGGGGGRPGARNTPQAFSAGGTVYGPTSALLGEAGYPETVVPHRNDPRSRELALEALRGTGQRMAGGGAPVFSPNINITMPNGGSPDALRATLRDATDDMFVMFTQWWEDMQRGEARESYA